MFDYEDTRLTIGLVAVAMAVIYAVIKLFVKKNKVTTQYLTRTAILAALATILYTTIKIPIPGFPPFLELHFDEVPAMIAGFAYGPISGVAVIAVKTVLKLPMSSTLCVGELADFIYGIMLVVPSSLIYRKFRNLKGATVGLTVAGLIQTISAAFITTFVMLDFYMAVMGLPKELILELCQKANPTNPFMTNLNWAFLLFIGLPFNAVKDIVLILLTLLLYKKMHKFIDRISA